MTTKTGKPRPSKTKLNGKPLPPNCEILTLPEAAGFLRVSEEGLRADAINGKVPGRLVAGEWRFSRVALLNWLGQSGTNSPKEGTDSQLRSSKEKIRALIGVWKDDPTVDAMVEEIYRQRKSKPVDGV
jgi:hypothetical protein